MNVQRESIQPTPTPRTSPLLRQAVCHCTGGPVGRWHQLGKQCHL
ncbi:hypothetical protein DUNSADRAFT_15840 [Dunaliella salina]|uniref:Encoded protein n=1 Tax=Dunaliella salina TaxID=3046 RepID=A0ABQ7G4U0_DUNSA|nr:hypothetical protein DUNSADRAFT_15840 [Dunaliella salina]|eukprot:KAF5829621.1 hypothetical protein DUNSADRAFT_15840 [Dunaliella salina]